MTLRTGLILIIGLISTISRLLSIDYRSEGDDMLRWAVSMNL